MRVCVIGCGAIGSLYAAHLALVTEVWAFVRRDEHAAALNQHGLRVSGTHDFTATLKAETDPARMPEFDLGISATKANDTASSFAPVAHLFNRGAVMSAQNGMGSEEALAAHTKGYIIRGTTFMSGTRHSDTHVQYELETPTWLGPFEPSNTPFELVERAADLLVRGGLKAEALRDARPAQWSKLIFNAAVNGASALTELPHSREFAACEDLSDLGHLVRDLMEEGKRVAAAARVELHDDPWEMNKIGAETDHPPSMLYDIQHRLPTEVDFLSGAIAREAQRLAVPAPLHTAVWRLINAKEASWRWGERERKKTAHHALKTYRTTG